MLAYRSFCDNVVILEPAPLIKVPCFVLIWPTFGYTLPTDFDFRPKALLRKNVGDSLLSEIDIGELLVDLFSGESFDGLLLLIYAFLSFGFKSW